MEGAVLKIAELKVRIAERYVIDDISLSISKGEVLALVGESGSGKTLTALAVLDLLPESAVRENGRIFFNDKNILLMDKEEKRKMRGQDIAMVFQEPFMAMNPVMNVGNQIREAINAHIKFSSSAVEKRIDELLDMVRLPAAIKRSYPHEMSGGMRQRVMFAIALACSPEILILDEPTTALDVSIQKEMLDLITRLQADNKFAVLFITHDFSVVDLIADSVAVMKTGKIIEYGAKNTVLSSPRDKYTKKLIECIPRIGDKRRRLIVDA